MGLSLTGLFLFNSYAAVNNNKAIFTPGLNLLSQAQLVGPTNPAKKIDFTVQLKVKNKKKFDQLFNEIYDPGSLRYHQFLSRDEYQAEFAPDTKTMELVKGFFSAHGMKATIKEENVVVTATIKQIEQTFKIKVNNYRYQNKIVYSNTTAPKIDGAIAKYISGITGLSNIPLYHPLAHFFPLRKITISDSKVDQANQNTLTNLAWDSFVPAATPTDTSLNGFTGQHLRTTYNMAAIPPVNGTIIDGSGQTLIIVDGCGNNDPQTIMSDANHFSTVNNLPILSMTPTPGQRANFAVVDKYGHPISSCIPSGDWTGEITLDIASSHTIAPHANIVLVIDSDLDVGTVINTIIHDNFSIDGFANAYTISNSWGQHEYNNPTLEMNLQKAAMLGMSVDFASGDCGDHTYSSSWPSCSTASSTPYVGYPSASPYATAIGGSSMFVDVNYNYAFESGWGSYNVDTFHGRPPGFYAGSSGGISQIYTAPSWQKNPTFQGFMAGGYGVIGSYQGGGMRAVPDVAMLADLFTGLIIYYTGGCEQGCISGGTSLACPLYTSTLALVNQARFLQKKQSIGLSAEYLYTLNQALAQNQALNVITPPHLVMSNIPNPANAPNYSFTLYDHSVWFNTHITFNWDSSLTMNENQYWNDVVGVGSARIPNFVPFMAAQ